MDLASTWKSIQDEMLSSLRGTRAAFSHAGVKGTANENAVAEFLREHLPSSIGIASGQVVDFTGNTSRQLDVILYDAARTPILYSDRKQTNQVLPIEGVIAIIEVKTRVSTSDVPQIMDNMRSVKELSRGAYLPPAEVVKSYRLLGMETPYFPSIYSLFAFEVESIESFGSAIGTENMFQPTHQRVDLSCLLDSGVLVNTEPAQDRYFGAPTPTSIVGTYRTQNSLLLWFLLFSQLVLQAQQPAIDLSRYVPHDFSF